MKPIPRGRVCRALLFDADDTLWENNIYYLECTRRFLDLMRSWGADREATASHFDQAQREFIHCLGYGPDSYIAALETTCSWSLAAAGRRATPERLAQARSCGAKLLSPPMELLPGVACTLRALRETSRLVLVTKGLAELQLAKLARSGLEALFEARFVVPEKTVDTYRQIVAALALEPRNTWMIGNSPHSDINPALAAGIRAIYVPHPHTWTAEHEDLAFPERTVCLERFEDLLTWFG
ncbi:MAG: HAD family hydrolase [Anaerolineae bacterium]|nr:HAD family hydrolase [Anaerolineae bacterium]